MMQRLACKLIDPYLSLYSGILPKLIFFAPVVTCSIRLGFVPRRLLRNRKDECTSTNGGQDSCMLPSDSICKYKENESTAHLRSRRTFPLRPNRPPNPFQNISTMQPIHKMQRPIINVELFMMQIVHLGHGGLGKIIAAVLGRANEQHADEKRVERENMHGLVVVRDEREREHDGDDVGEEVLDGRSIEAREGDGRGEAVMQFVIASVETRVVQDAVDVVGENLPGEVADDEVLEKFFEFRELWGDDEDGAEVGEVAEGDLEGDVAEGDEEGVADAVEDLGGGGLAAGVGLVFVGFGELRAVDVDELVDCGGEPEADQLDEDGDDQLDLPGGVVSAEFSPEDGEGGDEGWEGDGGCGEWRTGGPRVR